MKSLDSELEVKRKAIKETLLQLLITEKSSAITISCGLRVMDQIMYMVEYSKAYDDTFLYIADCWVKVEKDFELDPWEIRYKNNIMFKF